MKIDDDPKKRQTKRNKYKKIERKLLLKSKQNQKEMIFNEIKKVQKPNKQKKITKHIKINNNKENKSNKNYL